MIRKLVCAVAVMVVTVGFVMADEFTASVTEYNAETGAIAYFKTKKGAKGKAGEREGDLVKGSAKGAKLNKGTQMKGKVEVGDKVEPADFAKQVKDAGEKGVNARITTEGDKITDIVITTGKKKAAAE